MNGTLMKAIAKSLRVEPTYPHPCSTSLSGLFSYQSPDLLLAEVRPVGHPSTELWEDRP